MYRKLRERVLLGVSFLCLGALLIPVSSIQSIKNVVICGIVILALLILVLCLVKEEKSFCIERFAFDAIIIILLVHDFIVKWFPSRKIGVLAEKCGISSTAFLVIAGTVLAVLSIKAIYSCHNYIHALFTEKLSRLPLMLQGVRFILVVILQYLMIEYSYTDLMGTIFNKSVDAFFANIFILCAVNLILFAVLQNGMVSLIITSAVLAFWAIANYYTILFHGSPLYFSEFSNIRTALAVLFNYHYHISGQIVCIALLLVEELIVIIKYFRSEAVSTSLKKRFVLRISSAVICGLAAFLCYQSTIERNRPWMPWDVSMEQSGFLVSVAEDAAQRLMPINEPDGYDESLLLEAAPVQFDSNTNEFPDIILILNESLCDLNVYSELSLDNDYLKDFYSVEGAYYGYAIAPNIGSGTNDTEFELLTSKSMYLLSSMAPFTYLDDELLKRSMVNYLEKAGYSTAGLHCEKETNYARDIAYPALGFDRICLGPDAFAFRRSNGNRIWLDSDNYQDMVDCYTEMGEGPRFMYLLTFQNHGGFEQNSDDLDSVHVLNDFGALTDDLNEYLSSVELSGKAFRELTEYFRKNDRKVIICMVGDHAPSFINDLPSRTSLSIEEGEILKRVVPYVMWSNYGAVFEESPEFINMVDIAPILMESAGIPLTTYYKLILDLSYELPERTSTGLYKDKNGNIEYYSKDDPVCELLSMYYYMEYNSFLDKEKYHNELFELND